MKEQTRGKRLLSFLLCFVMIFGMLPMSAIPAQAANAFATEVLLYYDAGSSSNAIVLNAATPYAWPYSSAPSGLKAGTTLPSSETKYVYFDAQFNTLRVYGGGKYSPLYLPAIRVNGIHNEPVDLRIWIYDYVELCDAQISGGSTSIKSFISNFTGGDIVISGLNDNANLRLKEKNQDNQAAVGVYIADSFQSQDTTGSLKLQGSLTMDLRFDNDDYCPIGIYVPGKVEVTGKASLYSEMGTAINATNHAVEPIYASELFVDTEGYVKIYANDMGSSHNTQFCRMVSGDVNVYKAIGGVVFSFPQYLPREGIDEVCGGTVRYENIYMAEHPHNNQVEYIYVKPQKPLPSEIFLGGKPLSEQNVYMKNGDAAPTANSGGYNAYYDYSSGTLYLNNYNAGPIAVASANFEKMMDLKIHLTGNNTVNIYDQKIQILSFAALQAKGIEFFNNGNLTIEGDTSATLNLKATGNAVEGTAGIYMSKKAGGGNIPGENCTLTIRDNVTVNVELTAASDVQGVYLQENSKSTPYTGGTLTLKDSASLNVKVTGDTTSSLCFGIKVGNLVLNTTGSLTVENDKVWALHIGRPADSRYTKVGRLYLKSGTENKALNSAAVGTIDFSAANYIIIDQRANTPSVIEYINKIGKTTWTVANYGGTTDRGEVGEYLEDEYPVLSTKPIKNPLLQSAVDNGTLNFLRFEEKDEDWLNSTDNPYTMYYTMPPRLTFYTIYDLIKNVSGARTLLTTGSYTNYPHIVITMDKPAVTGSFEYYAVREGCSYYDTANRVPLPAPMVSGNQLRWEITGDLMAKFGNGLDWRLVAKYGNDIFYSECFYIRRNYNTITFVDHGATGGTDPGDRFLTAGETFTFPENPYTKDNCTFLWWMWDGDPYQPGETEKFYMYGQPKVYDTPVEIEAVWKTDTPALGYDYANNKFTGMLPGFRYYFSVQGAGTGRVNINDDGSYDYSGSLAGMTVLIYSDSAADYGITSDAQTLAIHKCTPAAEWTKNETHHWKACTDANCPITENANKLNYGEHIYDGDLDFTCNTCGYEREKPSLTNVQISPLGIITGDGFTGAAYYRISCNGRNLGNFRPTDGKLRINLNLVTSVYGITLNTGDTANISIVALNSAHEVISAEWTDSFIVEFDQGIVQIWNSDDLTYLKHIESYTKAHTAVIMSDFTTSSSCYFDVNKDFTIDLNGHTLKLSGHLDFTPESAVNFKITDTSTEKTGKLVEMSPLSELIYLSGSETYSGESTLIIDGICIEGSTATRTVSAISNYATHAINLVIKNTTIKDYYQAIGNASKFSDIKISDTVISVVKNAQGYLTNSRVTIGEILDTNQKLVLYNTTQDCVYDTPAASTYANTLIIYSKTDTQDAIEIRIAAPIGVTVSGSATSFNSDTDDVVLQLIAEGTNEAAYEVIVNGNSASYSIEGVLPATYTLKVMKLNHVTREYTVTVASDNVAQDVKICLKGDVDGNGTVNVRDVNRTNLQAKGKLTLDTYEFACANVTTEATPTVNVRDVNKINLHAKGKASLW